jgi:DNA polymerase III delta prime subunit
MMKHPGAREPAWPNGEQVHIRGLDEDDDGVTFEGSSFYTRKRKAANKPMSVDQSVLSRFATQLSVEEDGELRSDGFREPHQSLRLPRKHLISGHDILNIASKELSTSHLDDSVDELSSSGAIQHTAHPAIETLRKRVASKLSAFDEGSGEINNWTQKYAPSAAGHVLQPSREMDVLKSWLTSLTITAVEGAARHEPRQSPRPDSKPRKKRKRKNKDLDDFLVDSDEEVHDMDELTDPEDMPLLSTERRGAKSVVQSASDGVKLSNAVLLTGPHGSGKTAAAYAVAKELGFQVFEISSCEKRSGKDVLDKVGDMAENHLVRHHGTESGETSAAEEPSRFDEALQQDIASGRQGKMDAFFKPKTVAKKTSPKKQSAKPKVKAIEQLQKAIKKPPKDQQQSLILLEEVDILFKEDKDFWNTVLKLITTSKRPFIMICNDEDLVPLQAMALHAILRFSPPPIDLATDYLLVMAAAEGHLINRNAIHDLYRHKDSDLRASISELQFWCQMGIGDPRGGLSWIYQRYPPGSDLDEQGRQLRVVSQGSYQHGMGQVPDSRLSDEEQALWAVEAPGIDPLTDLGSNYLLDTQFHTLPALRRFERYTASMSAADVYTACLDTPKLDTSRPPMTDKARSQYIEGMRLLQIDEIVRYDTLSHELAVVTALTAQQVAGFARPNDGPSRVKACISASKTTSHSDSLTRRDFACFDAISLLSDNVLSTTPGLSQSTFDGPLDLIATDIAPYVRSILQHEAALAEQHDRLNSIMGDGRNAKRLRTTRAARSALQGSQRSLTRREKWFTKDLDVASVLATGGKDWPKMIACLDEFDSREGTETPSPSAESI